MAAVIQERKQRKRSRRDLARRLERTFDLRVLPTYLKRIKAEHSRSRLTGVVTAGAFYTVFFVIGFTIWKFGIMPEESFGKLTWIMMIPATVVGGMTWLIAANRREFPIRVEAKEHIARLEKGGGMLWRYEPLLDALRPEDMIGKRAMEQSRIGGERIVPEDYIKTAQHLEQAVQEAGSVPSRVVDAIEARLAMTTAAPEAE